MSRLVSVRIIVGLLVLSFVPSVARAEEAKFEGAPKLKASALLPPELLKSPHHTVREAVAWNGNLFQFEIESDFGLFRVGSRRMLERRVKEIRTMGKLVTEAKGNAYFDGLQKKLVALPSALVVIVEDPAKTVTSVPKVVNKTFGRLGHMFDHKSGGGGVPDPDSVRKSLVASEKRKLAKELSVDPYSTNAKLQQLLDEVATQRYVGGLTISLASYAIPGGAGTIIYDTASYRSEISGMLADLNVDELRERNAGELKKMGVHRYLANRFLQSTVILPSFQTAIVKAMSILDGVFDREAIIEAALEARDVAQATLHVEQAAALANYHQSRGQLTKLNAVGGAVVARTRSGGALVLAPIDGAYWDQDTSHVLRAVRASPLMASANRRVLYVKGVSTPRFQQEVKKSGITVAGWPAAKSAGK